MLDQEGKDLTPEAYSRFRSALGKLSWYAQTRQDIRAWSGLLASQQAKPIDCTEKALKAVLRYLYEDQRVVLRIPAEIPPRDGQSHPMALTQEDRLVCFSDASHAPLKSTGRRGLTFEQWSKTLVTMAKYKKEKMSFSELYSKAAVEVESRKYCSWILKTYGTDDNLQTKTEQGVLQFVHQPNSQAIDLAAFLKATKFASQICGESEGYRREFK
eukprot:s5941_g1.t1